MTSLNLIPSLKALSPNTIGGKSFNIWTGEEDGEHNSVYNKISSKYSEKNNKYQLEFYTQINYIPLEQSQSKDILRQSKKIPTSKPSLKDLSNLAVCQLKLEAKNE